MQVSRFTWLVSVVCICACAPQEILESKPAEAPPGVDFSGNWRINTDSAAERQRINDAINKAAGGGKESAPPPQGQGSYARHGNSPSRKSGGGFVQVFLESGRHLKITQTDYGIFISYDRSVVREFRFGENRMVSVGEIQAQRVSGWDGDRYVVESLDRKGMKLTEQFYFSDDHDTLQIHIVLRSSDNSEVTMRQSYVREGNTP